MTITNTTFTDNRAGGNGGGIAIVDGTLTLTNSTFTSNRADGNGGAIANHGTLTVTNSTFSGNSAALGGVVLIIRAVNNALNGCL